MNADRDLHLLVLAIQKHVIDPCRLAQVLADWTPEELKDGVISFLVRQGTLSPDDLHRLELMTTQSDPHESAETASIPLGSLPVNADATTRGEPLSGSETVPFDSGSESCESNQNGEPFVPPQRFEILGLHETGGLGLIWRARDRVIGREVALKTLRPDRAGTEHARSRFVREAQVTGQLEHPSIVPLYDLSSSGNTPFYVMRFISGRTLSQVATDYHHRRKEGQVKPLDLVSLLDAFVGVCRAVAFAHRHEVLHRDLKGQNVVVGEFGEVFLLDWGLAKQVGEVGDLSGTAPSEGGDSGEDTAPGSAVGTPGYMAPEVARGAGSTKKSDIYGLGAVLYSLLTGRAPYSGSSVNQVLRKIITTDPSPIRSIHPEAPAALEAICKKAMARNPDDRYDSAEEVSTEVRRWLADEPVHAYPEPWGVRFARWARRRKTTVIAVAIFLTTAALVAALAAILLWQEEQRTAAAKELAEQNAELAQREQLRAEQNAQRAEDEQLLAEQNAELARTVSADALALVQAVEWVLASTESLHRFRKDLLDSGSRTFRDELARNPDDTTTVSQAADVFLYTANVFRLEGNDSTADALYQEAAELLNQLIAADPADPAPRLRLVNTLKDWAVLRSRTGPQAEANALYQQAMAALEPLRGPEDELPEVRRSLARILLNQSVSLELIGDQHAALNAARHATDLFAELVDLPLTGRHPYDPLMLARALTLSAARERDLGQIERAKDIHVQAVRAYDAVNKSTPYGMTQADVAWTVAVCRLERGKTWALDRDPRAWGALDAAVSAYEQLAAGFSWVIGYPSGLADALIIRADAKAAVGFPDARDDYDRARAVAERLVEQQPDVPRYRSLLGNSLIGLATTVRHDPERRDEFLRLAEEHLARAVLADPDAVDDRTALEKVRAARN
ncbi:serine/threonine protein kinase [Tautonia rosea]|uniref:serine/threonine protein kinase n=1 Tax=Tautonia rosea TaxID=2728037 RepID=UPI0014753A94|nr:serine/threonine-protein kinase [Tautonia rosea]